MVDVKPLRYHYSVLVIVAGGAAKMSPVLSAVLDNSLGFIVHRRERIAVHAGGIARHLSGAPV